MEKCFICNEDILNEHYALSNHLKHKHNILRKAQYLEQYVYSNIEYMKCECGCGEPAPRYRLWPYKSKFIQGHNSRGKLNPRYGTTVSECSRNKMKESAKIRVNKQLSENGFLPMHSPDAIEKRAQKQTKRYIDRIEKQCDITILSSDRKECGIAHYKIQCNKCSHIYEQWHSEYLDCPKCNKKVRSSLEEKLYEDLNKFVDLVIIRNDRAVLDNRYELDFYFPDYNLGVEIHGLYYHSELKGRTPTYHLQKLEYCTSKGIDLIQVFEDEFLTHYDVVLNKILRKLNLATYTKLHARNCTVKQITAKETKPFLEKYHLQGTGPASIHLGLYHNDVLVSVMTFGKPNASKGIKNGQFAMELVRYAVSFDYNVRGGASKLLRHFINMDLCTTLVSYADLRWVNKSNNLYISLGFKHTNTSKPNYWYFKNNLVRYHRFNFTKKKTIMLGGSPTNTEWENMQLLGWNRIWDCGNLRYELLLETV